MKTVSVDAPKQFCPCCNRFFDSATCTTEEGAKPEAGAITICLYCHEILTWNKNMNLERLSDFRFLQLPKETQIELNNLIFIIRNAH